MNYYHVQDTEITVHRNGMEKRIFRRGTAQRAGEFAEKFGKREWGYCCGMLHDIGKYSKEFQKKIQENTNDKVDHATAGAQVCKELGGYYPILSYCIAGHHAGLPDYGNTAISSSLCGRWKKKICDYQDYKDEVEIPDLDTEPIKFKEDRNMDFSLGTFISVSKTFSILSFFFSGNTSSI